MNGSGRDPGVLELRVARYLFSTSKPKKFEELEHVKRPSCGSCDSLSHQDMFPSSRIAVNRNCFDY